MRSTFNCSFYQCTLFSPKTITEKNPEFKFYNKYKAIKEIQIKIKMENLKS